jgi:hypothetical protein
MWMFQNTYVIPITDHIQALGNTEFIQRMQKNKSQYRNETLKHLTSDQLWPFVRATTTYTRKQLRIVAIFNCLNTDTPNKAVRLTRIRVASFQIPACGRISLASRAFLQSLLHLLLTHFQFAVRNHPLSSSF